MMKSFIIMVVLAAALLFSGCIKEPTPVDSTDIDYDNVVDIKFSEHVQPLLNRNCVSCHGATRADAGLRLDNWLNITFGAAQGEAIIAFNSEQSRMIKMLTKLTNNVHPADQGKAELTTEEIDFLARWIDEGAMNDDGHSPYEHSHHSAYVCNQNSSSVSIIDGHSLVVTRYVDLADYGYADSQPHMIAIAPDNESWYVSLISSNKVLKFTAEANELVGEIAITAPALLMEHPTDHVLYVSRFVDASQSVRSIFAVDTETMLPAAGTDNGEIALPVPVPHALALDSDYVYTASLPEDFVIRISSSQKEMTDLLYLGANKGPLHCALSPDNQRLFVSCITSDEIAVIDVSSPDQMNIVSFVPVGQDPWHGHFAHDDDDRLWVGNNRSFNYSTIDPQTLVAHTYGAGDGSDGFSWPHGVAIDEEYVYFSNQNQSGSYIPRNDFGDNAETGTVVILRLSDQQIIKVLEVGNFATGIHLTHVHQDGE